MTSELDGSGLTIVKDGQSALPSNGTVSDAPLRFASLVAGLRGE